jgi:hypothetical protein
MREKYSKKNKQIQSVDFHFQNKLIKIMPAPVVTGLSPKEGTPGTKVTIRGEYLGQRPSDLIGKLLFPK